jgi:hypothetical protein
MGQEITSTRFNRTDFVRFEKALECETEHLQQLIREQKFSNDDGVVGFELEACLVDNDMSPMAVNEALLKSLDDAVTFSPELSQFNIEINGTPSTVDGSNFEQLFGDLTDNWTRGQWHARQHDSSMLMIGILPTLKDSDLVPENMSKMTRFRALNQHVLRLRKGKPIELNIQGEYEKLHSRHMDVMLEAATTSFQTHLQVSQHKVGRYYNAFSIASAPVVALSANSPFLFGKQLWQETRIPLFEQAVPVGGYDGASFGPVRRVSLGSGYIRHSIAELYENNLQHFPPLLPFLFDDDIGKMTHLNLHNGTIWRWNRPIIGFNDVGEPHFRIEHRTLPAGPTPIDMLANFAFLLGLVTSLAESEQPPEHLLQFSDSRDNFYAAAKYGLNSHVKWLNGSQGRMVDLLPALINEARRGLERRNVDFMTIQLLLSVISGRVKNGQTGAIWQQEAAQKCDGDLHQMTMLYQQYQEIGEPVHHWPI